MASTCVCGLFDLCDMLVFTQMDRSVFVMWLLGSLLWWTGESDVKHSWKLLVESEFWKDGAADTLASSWMRLPLCCIPTPNL